jgi:imidazolonepropionase-like amidohydrolase
MSPMQAVQSATIVAARLIGWDDRLGSVAPGKYADLVAIDGDAMVNLESFANVAFVMKDGVVYKDGGQPVGRAVPR